MSRKSRQAQSRALARRPAEPPAAPPSNVVELRSGGSGGSGGSGIEHTEAWTRRMESGMSRMDYLRLVQGFDSLDAAIAVNSTEGFRRMSLETQRSKHTPGSVDPPVGTLRREWNADSIQRALVSHELGLFNESALLADSMVGDSRISHAINVRCKGFLNRKPYMLPPKRAKDQKLAKLIADEMSEIYTDIVTPEVAEVTMFRQPLMGFSLHNVTWEENQGIVLPAMRHYHETWTFFLMDGSLENRVLQAIAQGGGKDDRPGNVPIHDDDEDWFLFAPFGKYRGWMRGGIAQVAIPWLVRNLSLRDWSRLAEVHGMPIRIVKVPATASEPDKARIFAQAQEMGSEAVFVLPVAGDGSGFSVELLECTNTKSWEVMSELGHRCDSDIEIALAGTQLLGQLGDQSSAGKSSSMAASKEVRAEQDDYAEQDAIRYAHAFRTGPLRRTVLYNYGPEAEDCIPLFSLSNEPPAEKSDTAKCWVDVSTALLNFQQVGVPITKQFLEAAKEEFEIPFDTTKDLVPPAPREPAFPAVASPRQLPAHDDTNDDTLTQEARGSMVVQSIAIEKGKYSLEQAKQWLTDHDFGSDCVEQGSVYAAEQRSADDFDDKSFRNVAIASGITFNLGRIKRHDPQPTVKGDEIAIRIQALESALNSLRSPSNPISLASIATQLSEMRTQIEQRVQPVRSERPARQANHEQGQAYVDRVSDEAMKLAVDAIAPHLRRVQELIDNAQTPEDLRKQLKRLASDVKRGHLETIIQNARLMSHLAGRVSEK